MITKRPPDSALNRKLGAFWATTDAATASTRILAMSNTSERGPSDPTRKWNRSSCLAAVAAAAAGLAFRRAGGICVLGLLGGCSRRCVGLCFRFGLARSVLFTRTLGSEGIVNPARGDVSSSFQPRTSVGSRALGIVLEEHEEPLKFSHAEPLSLAESSELLCQSILSREEPCEHAVQLVLRGEADVAVHVHPPRSHQGSRQPLEVVSCHEDDSLLCRHNTIQSVEETAEADAHHPSVWAGRVCWLRLPHCEVHILQEHQAPRRNHCQEVLQPVVSHPWVPKIQDANVVAELASQGSDKRRLTTARRTVEQVATSVGNASVQVPLVGLQELSNICQDLLGGVLIQDDRLEWPDSLGAAEWTPLMAILLVNDSHSFLSGQSRLLRLLEQLLENLWVPGRGGQGQGLPGRASGHVHGSVFSLSVHHKGGAPVPHPMPTRARDVVEGC
mmetsp:Transcript_58520/g.124123  ORF Transcript_58520/g.124123 Transcript_58520/m.124123 type:complete len:445 (-) Transcript_58520:486-1820(-)